MKKKTETENKITTLAGLEGALQQEMVCRFHLDVGEQQVEIKVKPISPALQERVRAITRAVVPPYIPARKDYDPLDAKYQEERDKAQLTARAVIVYFCCPEVNAKKAGLQTNQQIYEFVQSLLTENILDLLALTAQKGGLGSVREVKEGANFTFTPALES